MAQNKSQLALIPGLYECVNREGIGAREGGEDLCQNTCHYIRRSWVHIHLGWNVEDIDEAKSVDAENDGYQAAAVAVVEQPRLQMILGEVVGINRLERRNTRNRI